MTNGKTAPEGRRPGEIAHTGRKITLDGKPLKANAGASSVQELLFALKISPQEALVKVNGKIRPDAFPLKGAKKIEIIRVVFGG